MARHNREGRGTDQSGFEYRIGYQPDWLRHVKVTRDLEGGRQSTKTLFRNPVERREALPGDQVRARITCLGQELDFGVAISDPRGVITRIRVACSLPSESGGSGREEVAFTFENRLPPLEEKE